MDERPLLLGLPNCILSRSPSASTACILSTELSKIAYAKTNKPATIHPLCQCLGLLISISKLMMSAASWTLHSLPHLYPSQNHTLLWTNHIIHKSWSSTNYYLSATAITAQCHDLLVLHCFTLPATARRTAHAFCSLLQWTHAKSCYFITDQLVLSMLLITHHSLCLTNACIGPSTLHFTI